MPTVREFLEKHNVPHSTTHHHSRAGWVQIQTCPYCHSANFHLGMTLDGRRCACWKCGPHNPSKTLRLVSNAPWSEIRLLAPDVLETLPERSYGVYTPPTGIVDLLPKDREYLISRNLDPDEMVELWGLQSVHPASGMPCGIFIPITYNSKPVSWTIRIRNPQGIRYLTAKDDQKSMPEKHLVFGHEKCQGSVIVVEGPFDMFRVGPGAGCLFGLQYTMAQVAMLAKYHTRLICFDNSPDAQRRAAILASDLSAYPGMTAQVTLSSDDPGEATDEEIRELRELAGV